MKPLVAIASPYTSRSGYGDHSRDLISALLNSDKYKAGDYKIELIPIPWGNTPQNGLNENNFNHIQMFNLTKTNLDKKPDVFIHIALPNEFAHVGDTNIGITAGIEADKISDLWKEKVNNFDLLIVPSKFTKETFKDCKTKVVNLFEGVNTDVFKKEDFSSCQSEKFKELYEAEEEFLFLYTGHMIPRKNIDQLINSFMSTFDDMKGEIGLVLKTSGAGFSLIDLENTKKQIHKYLSKSSKLNNIPNIYLVHSNLTESEMNELYNIPKIKAMISTTHGEGYGRPLAEFAVTGKPVLVTGWSGQMDFLNTNKHSKEFLFDYNLRKVQPEVVWKDVLLEDAKWAYPVHESIVEKLSNVYFDYDNMVYKFKSISENIITNMNFLKMQEKFIEIVEQHILKKQYKEIDVSDLDFDFSKMKRKGK